MQLLRSGVFATAAELKRFRAEAQIVARLQHPDIVTLHEVGENERQPFYSIKRAPGAVALRSRLRAFLRTEMPAC